MLNLGQSLEKVEVFNFPNSEGKTQNEKKGRSQSQGKRET